MKLTVELLGASRSALNAVRERELDLRGARALSKLFAAVLSYSGHKIPAIENLGASKVRMRSITTRASRPAHCMGTRIKMTPST